MGEGERVERGRGSGNEVGEEKGEVGEWERGGWGSGRNRRRKGRRRGGGRGEGGGVGETAGGRGGGGGREKEGNKYLRNGQKTW